MWFALEASDQKRSIENHLKQLFNTRKGAVSYLPDYGLPDLNEIYQQLPDSMGALVSSVQALIKRYEPRLSHVRIIPYLSDAVDCVVYLKLEANLAFCAEAAHFETHFLSGGEATIQWTPQ